MPPTFQRHESVDEFLAVAGAFLEAREAENNLLFGISSAVRSSPELFAEDAPSFATVADDAGRTVAATLRTPPHNQVLSWIDELDAVDAIVDALRAEPLPGLLGSTEAAARFASAWTDATGQFTDLANPTSNKIYRAIGYEPVCDMDQYRFASHG